MAPSDEELTLKAAKLYLRSYRFSVVKYVVFLALAFGFFLYKQYWYVPSYRIVYIDVPLPGLTQDTLYSAIETELKKSDVNAVSIKATLPLDESMLSALSLVANKPIYLVETQTVTQEN